MEKYLNSMLMKNTEVEEQPINLKTLSDKLTMYSVNFIRESENRSTPFGLYHAFPNVHTPLQPHPRFRGLTSTRYGDRYNVIYFMLAGFHGAPLSVQFT